MKFCDDHFRYTGQFPLHNKSFADYKFYKNDHNNNMLTATFDKKPTIVVNTDIYYINTLPRRAQHVVHKWDWSLNV